MATHLQGRSARPDLTALVMAPSPAAEGIDVMAPIRAGATPGWHFLVRRSILARLSRSGVVAALALLFAFALVPPASAHGGEETEEGYLLVQQALGHLAHDTSHVGVALAMEKVDDALATEDQDGVDVAAVEKAKTALETDQVDTARTLLQGSIKEALSELPPATGGETGTTVIVPALPGRDGLTGRDWSFIAASVMCLLAGAFLAYRFRPADAVGELRRRYGGSR